MNLPFFLAEVLDKEPGPLFVWSVYGTLAVLGFVLCRRWPGVWRYSRPPELAGRVGKHDPAFGTRTSDRRYFKNRHRCSCSGTRYCYSRSSAGDRIYRRLSKTQNVCLVIRPPRLLTTTPLTGVTPSGARRPRNSRMRVDATPLRRSRRQCLFPAWVLEGYRCRQPGTCSVDQVP